MLGNNELEKWKSFFQQLATLHLKPEFDDAHKSLMELQRLLNRSFPCIEATPASSEEQTVKLIATFKNNKAPDRFSFCTSEHIRYASSCIIPCQSHQQVVCRKKYSHQPQNWDATPIPKKEETMDWNKYSCITVTYNLVEKKIVLGWTLGKASSGSPVAEWLRRWT